MKRKRLNKMIGKVVSVILALLMIISTWSMIPSVVRATETTCDCRLVTIDGELRYEDKDENYLTQAVHDKMHSGLTVDDILVHPEAVHSPTCGCQITILNGFRYKDKDGNYLTDVTHNKFTNNGNFAEYYIKVSQKPIDYNYMEGMYLKDPGYIFTAEKKVYKDGVCVKEEEAILTGHPVKRQVFLSDDDVSITSFDGTEGELSEMTWVFPDILVYSNARDISPINPETTNGLIPLTITTHCKAAIYSKSQFNNYLGYIEYDTRNNPSMVQGYSELLEEYYKYYPEMRPIEKPTENPTKAPTVKPTQAPTTAPVVTPTVTPTEKPTTSTNVEKPTESVKPIEKETQASTEAETMVSTENTPVETPSESATAEVEVETSVEGIHTVKGQLKYKDGTPLADTYIELHSVVKKGRTNANGYYEFTGVESGDHKLTAFNENGDVIGEFSLTVGNDTTAMIVENAFTVNADAPVKNNNMAWLWVILGVAVVAGGCIAGLLIYKKKNA